MFRFSDAAVQAYPIRLAPPPAKAKSFRGCYPSLHRTFAVRDGYIMTRRHAMDMTYCAPRRSRTYRSYPLKEVSGLLPGTMVWAGEDDEIGYLVHKPGDAEHARWVFDYNAGEDDDDEAGYKFGLWKPLSSAKVGWPRRSATRHVWTTGQSSTARASTFQLTDRTASFTHFASFRSNASHS
ncbi:hypothetical protein M2175_003939 [Bradyrhizobium elkanii]|uniref:hypothetical protein n=1 Tax=Bradyrhizobium TaxID=374 RepID=UPI00216A8DBF|nr:MULTISPECIES: hypothetical protein [Bradyrhizobium]MCS3928908.1 hypothetical protein [Bradyrhizobium elkanii]MCS3969463.1 hypothetical protein [Bradyrhizobium japonicum]